MDSHRHIKHRQERFRIPGQEFQPTGPIKKISSSRKKQDVVLTAVTLGLSIQDSIISGPTECTTTTVFGFTLATA